MARLKAVSKTPTLNQASAQTSRDARSETQARRSEELVFALTGPVGCGLKDVRAVLEQVLRDLGYDVVPVKVTARFSDLARSFLVPDNTVEAVGEFDRITKYQDLGNVLRQRVGDDLGAQVAISDISLDRATKHEGVDIESIRPGRVAYIIDQLKNPKEAYLLKEVYGNLFYLVGVLAGYERRRQNLVRHMSGPQAEALIDRDRAEEGGGGQQLEKTLKFADFFVRNSHNNSEDLERPIRRFVELLHGRNGISPTLVERGMYAAFSAGLRSACLSRQVGASILDPAGNILSTGCNDVPQAGGGLYGLSTTDHRCVFKEGGVCFNDRHKDQLRDQIVEVLESTGQLDRSTAVSVAQKVRSDTRLKDLIEFSRAVHAEMDALISVARKGGAGVGGSILFTTTYPCHNCARHIIAAGISAVYFIEPYGKSLARELHDDAITHDSDGVPEPSCDKRVAFLHFEGVAPRRFSDLFNATESRKDESGLATRFTRASAQQKTPEFLDNYRQLESRVFQRLEKLKETVAPKPPKG